jgi:hypothetical protein
VFEEEDNPEEMFLEWYRKTLKPLSATPQLCPSPTIYNASAPFLTTYLTDEGKKAVPRFA